MPPYYTYVIVNLFNFICLERKIGFILSLTV